MSAEVSPSPPSLNAGEKTGSNSTNKEKPFHELLTKDMVDVLVGPKRKSFHLHKALLCRHSSFFQKALDGGFKEQDDKAIYLPDDDPGAFVLFVNWIYNASPKKATTQATVTSLFALYVMAEKFCIEELKNLSMDVIRASYCELGLISCPIIERLYDNTPETSLMRRFVANHTLYSLIVRKSGMAKEFRDLMRKGGDFAADFASATLQYSNGSVKPADPSRENNCAYHEHHSTKTCPSYAGFQESRLKGW